MEINELRNWRRDKRDKSPKNLPKKTLVRELDQPLQLDERAFTIALVLPPRELTPNARKHWTAKFKITKAYRESAFFAALQALARKTPPRWLQASVSITAYFPTLRQPDPDNFVASLKAAFDGIEDAGLVANDRGLWPDRPRFLKDPERPRVELTIREEVP